MAGRGCMMADFKAVGPDDVSAHLADDAHRPGDNLGEACCLAAEGRPGDNHANAADGRGAESRSDDGTGDGGTGDGGTAGDGSAEDGRRDGRLADFAQDRYGDTARPNAWHVMILNDLTGAGDRCPDATDDEALGLMGRWKAVESWAAARMLGVAREMIRRRAIPEKGMATPGLPWEWERELEHEVAAQLRVSLVAAGKLLHLAWSLEARLPGIGNTLSEGRLDPGQAKMIVLETDALPDDKATAAQELILAGLGDCHTWADLLRLVQRAVCTVDPDGARRRREQAERESARVRLWRESSGACALAGHALPTDEALAAWAHVEARAQHYRSHGIKEYIDLLRVMAYLDLLNGVPAADRIAQWTADAAMKAGTAKPGTGSSDTAEDHKATGAAPGHARPGPHGTGDRSGTPGGTAPGNRSPRGGAPDPGTGDIHADGYPGAACPGTASPGVDDRTDDPSPGDPRPEDLATGAGDAANTSGTGPSDTRPGGHAGPELRAKVNLTIPMGTATGHQDRPGEAWELGALDPALARQLLAAAARSPGSEFCVTVTDERGFAVGHGCCKPAKPAKPGNRDRRPPGTAPPGPSPPEGRATFTPRDGGWHSGCHSGCHSVGPPGGLGSWTLTLPGTATTFTVDLKPVPTHACDHAYQSAGHDPSDWLRHVVQVRDGKCSFPACGRHARESDFEHAIPHQDGGKTCACNCHACSRSCHQVKQRPGWSVTSPAPGWHQWRTPAGRTYTQGPWQYPV
jgi:Domain of unknown function (DUF222)